MPRRTIATAALATLLAAGPAWAQSDYTTRAEQFKAHPNGVSTGHEAGEVPTISGHDTVGKPGPGTAFSAGGGAPDKVGAERK